MTYSINCCIASHPFDGDDVHRLFVHSTSFILHLRQGFIHLPFNTLNSLMMRLNDRGSVAPQRLINLSMAQTESYFAFLVIFVFQPFVHSPGPYYLITLDELVFAAELSAFKSHSSSLPSSGSFPMIFATTGVKMTVGGNRIGLAAL